MSTAERFGGIFVATVLIGSASLLSAADLPKAPKLGKPLSVEAAAQWDLNVFPDGQGLPAGSGNAAEGRRVYEQKCASCHGERGRGATAEELAGGTSPLNSETPDKTIGLYWPYATTIFDFIRRAMPMDAPATLTADEVYAVTAYLLFINDIVAETDVLNAATLPKVRMPNRDGFIGIDAKKGRTGASASLESGIARPTCGRSWPAITTMSTRCFGAGTKSG